MYTYSINVTCDRTTLCTRETSLRTWRSSYPQPLIEMYNSLPTTAPRPCRWVIYRLSPWSSYPHTKLVNYIFCNFWICFVKQKSGSCCLLQKQCLRKLAVLILDVLPCSLVEIQERFEDNCRLYLQSNFVPDNSPSHPQIFQSMYFWCNESLSQK